MLVDLFSFSNPKIQSNGQSPNPAEGWFKRRRYSPEGPGAGNSVHRLQLFAPICMSFSVSGCRLSHLMVTQDHFLQDFFFIVWTVHSCSFFSLAPSLAISAGSWGLWNCPGNINHAFISQVSPSTPPQWTLRVLFQPACSYSAIISSASSVA